MSKANPKPYTQGRVILDKKMSLVTYAVTLILAVIARTSQLQNNMNFATGKYIDDSMFKNQTVGILVIGFILTALVLIFGKSRDKIIKSCVMINPMRMRAEKLSKKVSPKAGAALLLTAFLIVLDIFLDMASIINRNENLSTEDNPVGAFTGVTVLEWFMYGMAVVTVITFISMGANLFKGEGITKGNCVFLSVFAIWKLLQIFAMIGRGEVIGIYSEKVYIMLTAMASSMFFLYAAKLFAGFEKRFTRILVCIMGYVASTMAAVSVIPRYIIFFVKTYEERIGMATPSVSDVGLIFTTIAIISVFWGAYEYRDMPKLNLGGKQHWTFTNVAEKGVQMSSIEDEIKRMNKEEEDGEE